MPVRCSESAEPLLLLAPRHTVQGCIVGESMATCVNLIDSRFEPNLPRHKARTSTTRPVGWWHKCYNQHFAFLFLKSLVHFLHNLQNQTFTG